MRLMVRHGASVFTGLAVFGASFAFFIRQPTLIDPPRPYTGAVPSAPSLPLEWSIDPSRSAKWRAFAEAEGVDARARALGGDWSWFETAAELADLFFLANQRRACDATYGGAIEGRCTYSLHYVAEHLEKGTGRVVYARALLRDEKSTPAADVANDSGCANYIGCLAHARLNASIPLPPGGIGAEIAIHEHMQAHWGDPILHDPERLPTLIEHWKAARSHMADLDARGEITRVEDALRYRYYKSLVPYLQQHLQRIQDASDDD